MEPMMKKMTKVPKFAPALHAPPPSKHPVVQQLTKAAKMDKNTEMDGVRRSRRLQQNAMLCLRHGECIISIYRELV